MKLDKRLIKDKLPFDCFDAKNEEVRSFIGKKGYFADHISEFADISKLTKDELKDIIPNDPDDDVYKATHTRWHYFLPAEWVNSEKKCRPYTGVEFVEKFEFWVGHIIRIRDRPENAGQEYEYKILFVGYRWYKGLVEVFINGCWIDLLTLFELYEYMEDGKWHKFGVEA